jgi:hypothetical protein
MYPNIIFFLSHISNKNSKLLKWVIFQWRAYSVTLTLARFKPMFLYSANDVTSKCYYTSVIYFLLNRGYWISESSILNLLHELNKIILCELLVLASFGRKLHKNDKKSKSSFREIFMSFLCRLYGIVATYRDHFSVVCLSVCPSVCLSVCPSVRHKTCPDYSS